MLLIGVSGRAQDTDSLNHFVLVRVGGSQTNAFRLNNEKKHDYLMNPGGGGQFNVSLGQTIGRFFNISIGLGYDQFSFYSDQSYYEHVWWDKNGEHITSDDYLTETKYRIHLVTTPIEIHIRNKDRITCVYYDLGWYPALAAIVTSSRINSVNGNVEEEYDTQIQPVRSIFMAIGFGVSHRVNTTQFFAGLHGMYEPLQFDEAGWIRFKTFNIGLRLGIKKYI